MAGSIDTKDPLGLDAQLQKKQSSPDPLGLDAQLKKKVPASVDFLHSDKYNPTDSDISTKNSYDAQENGFDKSGGGSGNFQPLKVSNYDPSNQQAEQAASDQRHTGLKLDAHQHVIQRLQQVNPVKIKDEPERTTSDKIGQAMYLPAFNQGFNDLVTKPYEGASEFFNRTIAKAYKGLTGDDAPSWLAGGKNGETPLNNVVKYYDKQYATRDKPKGIISETAENVVGTLPLIASMATGSGEASVASKAPQLFGKLTKLMATTGALNAYRDASQSGEGYAQSIKDAGKGGAKGGIEGATMEAQMMLGGAFGKKAADLLNKGGTKTVDALLHAMGVSTMFGGTSAAEDLADGKPIDAHNAAKQFAMGLAFEAIPIAKGISDDVKNPEPEAANSAVLKTAASNLNAETALRNLIKLTPEQISDIHQNVPGTHEDLYAQSLEQGAKAYETDDEAEKNDLYKNQLLLKTQGDVKLLAKQVKENLPEIQQSIVNSDEISDEDKKDLLNKVNLLNSTENENNAKNEGTAGETAEAEKSNDSNEAIGEEKRPVLQEGQNDVTGTGEADAEPVLKEQDNAIQKQSSEGVPVQPKAGDSEEVPKGNAKGEETAEEGKKPKKLTLKRYEKKPPVSEVAKTMADKIRALKSEKGKAYGGLQGVATAVYDGALETAATTIEQGGKLVDAIQAAVDHIKKKYQDHDEDKIRKAISDDLAEAGLVDRYDEPEMVEANNAYLDAKVKGKFGVDAVDYIIGKLKDTDLGNIVDKVKNKIKGNATHLEDTRNKVLEKEGGSEEDQAALLLDQYHLKGQEENLINEINKSTDKDEIKKLQENLSKIQDDILDNATANRMIGREASTVFRLRQVAIDQNANLDYMREKYKASTGSKELTPEQDKEVREAYQKIREAEIDVKNAREAENKARADADRLQQENDALKKIINAAKQKHADTQKGAKDRLTTIRTSIDNSKKELGKLFGNISSGGVLQPEIYKHIGNIVKGKAEELYVKTKAAIDLNHLVKSVMDEIKDVAPDIKEQHVRDAISGNYDKEPRKPKTELQKNLGELKKQAKLLQRINDVQNKIETETKRKGESSPEVKKLQKELADLKKETKISGDYEKMQDGTLNTETKPTNRTEPDDRQNNINRYKEVQRQIKDIQGKIDRKEFTTPAKEAKKFEKSKALQQAERELAVRKYLWDKLNKQEMQKNRPLINKIGDNLMRWIRFTALSRVATIGKLATVVGQGLVSKPLKLAVQESIARMTPKSVRGAISGKVRPEAIAKYYSAAIRNFSIENLKNSFKGLDEADILYGRGKYMEDYDMGSGFYNDFLEAPGRAHGYLKSFIKRPETAFAHEQLMQDHIEKFQDIERQLKDADLSDKERSELQEKQKEYDVTNDEVRERINTQAAEHGKWSIFMNKNHGVEKFRNLLSAWTGEKQPSVATKTLGYLVKSDAPILKIPMNYARRFFLYKYGLLKAAIGTDWAGGDTKGIVGIALKGADDMTDTQKELFSRSLVYGSYGAALFVAGIYFKGKVKRNDDGTMDIDGKHFNKTETNIMTDAPGVDSFLSGTNFGQHLGRRRDEWAKAWVEADIDVAKKMPFNSLLKYGFMSNFALSLFQKDKDRTLTAVGKAAVQKAKNTIEPGAYQEMLQLFDPNNQERKPRNAKEYLKKEIPGLSKEVPR